MRYRAMAMLPNPDANAVLRILPGTGIPALELLPISRARTGDAAGISWVD
jgi:hypothetical protein